MKKAILIIGCVLVTYGVKSQIFYSKGATVSVQNGAIVHCNGGMYLSQDTDLNNDGEITITKNSTLNYAGNFEINSNSNVTGNGIYNVEQDWINSANFNAESSEVVLFGNTEQLITSNNNTTTQFNNLTLTGNGNGVNRRKTLDGVNSSVGSNGILNLNDRELSTNSFDFVVNNPSETAVLNSTVFEDEGFVSSTGDGYLIWLTEEGKDYLFPVGSSEGDRRYRPIMTQGISEDGHLYAARFNNYSAAEDGYLLSSKASNVGTVNDKFYHSFEDLSGNSFANLRFYYIPSADGHWDSYGAWINSESEWKNAEIDNKTTAGGFEVLTKENWDFSDGYTKYALVNFDHDVVISEAISVNDDKANDAFTIQGLQFYPNTQVWIYNRWGAEVFHSDDYQNDWEGKSTNKMTLGDDYLPEGTYFYIVQLGGDPDIEPGAGEIKKGFVYLKR